MICFPTDICAELFSTNSRLFAKNKTVTCAMRNNEHTFEASSVTISTYANTLVSTNLTQASYHSRGTDAHTFSFGVTINYKIRPSFLWRDNIFVATNSYFVRWLSLEFTTGLIKNQIENKTWTFLITIIQFNTASIKSARRTSPFFTAGDLAQAKLSFTILLSCTLN